MRILRPRDIDRHAITGALLTLNFTSELVADLGHVRLTKLNEPTSTWTVCIAVTSYALGWSCWSCWNFTYLTVHGASVPKLGGSDHRRVTKQLAWRAEDGHWCMLGSPVRCAACRVVCLVCRWVRYLWQRVNSVVVAVCVCVCDWLSSSSALLSSSPARYTHWGVRECENSLRCQTAIPSTDPPTTRQWSGSTVHVWD